MTLDQFIKDLHSSTTLLSRGKATVLGHEVDACEVRNHYGQTLVWGMFGQKRGKFRGHLANNAATEGVEYVPLS